MTKILTTNLAKATREICEELYTTKGSTAVYDYSNKIKLDYDNCKPCNASTPTITDMQLHTCALCGSNKDINISPLLKLFVNNPKSGYEFNDIFRLFGGNYNTLYSQLLKLVRNGSIGEAWLGLCGGRKKTYYLSLV